MSTESGSITLGVATGHARAIRDHIAQKTKVIKAMYRRTELCQDAQTRGWQCNGSDRARDLMDLQSSGAEMLSDWQNWATPAHEVTDQSGNFTFQVQVELVCRLGPHRLRSSAAGN